MELTLGLANGAWLDWVVAVSDNIRKALDLRSTEGVKIETIPVGAEAAFAGPARMQAANPARLIYVGRIEPQKNLPGLLEVLSALHNASVPFVMTIVGAGKELPAVRDRAGRMPCGGNITFLGARSQQQVARLLDEHDFLLMTSHYEGTPHAMLEAMAHGVVVLASRLPGATDRIITHGVDGFLCDRERPGEYVEIVRRVGKSPAEFAAVSKAARATVEARFSVEALAARYESIFGRNERRLPVVAGKSKGQIEVPPELRPGIPGFLFQCKHRIADAWRAWAKEARPVQPMVSR
jgi:glycosyltransferase involved in cell wall biosynthesis